MIEMIGLVMDNSIMGIDGQIPIVLKSHLDNFRKHIKGKVVVMGAHTYESLGESPFASVKETVIMSRHKKYGNKVRMCRSLVDLLAKHKDFIVIGGSSLFADIMPIANRIYLTEVSELAIGNNMKLFPSMKHMKLTNPDAEFQHEGDTYFRHLIYKR